MADNRELKARLSRNLREGEGKQILLDDQGRQAVRPVDMGGVSMVDRGIEEGWITPPSQAGLEPIEPRKVSMSTSEVLDEDRG